MDMAEAGTVGGSRLAVAEIVRAWAGFCSDALLSAEKSLDKMLTYVAMIELGGAVASLGWGRRYTAARERWEQRLDV